MIERVSEEEREEERKKPVDLGDAFQMGMMGLIFVPFMILLSPIILLGVVIVLGLKACGYKVSEWSSEY